MSTVSHNFLNRFIVVNKESNPHEVHKKIDSLIRDFYRNDTENEDIILSIEIKHITKTISAKELESKKNLGSE